MERFGKRYERATLHPEDSRFEAILPARIMPDQIFEVVYRELIRNLRHDLRSTEINRYLYYAFSYDWRHSLARTQAELGAFVDEIIARTKLMRHYANSVWDADQRSH